MAFSQNYCSPEIGIVMTIQSKVGKNTFLWEFPPRHWLPVFGILKLLSCFHSRKQRQKHHVLLLFLQRPWVAWWHKLFASLESVIGLMFFCIKIRSSLNYQWSHDDGAHTKAHGFSRKGGRWFQNQVFPSNHKLKKGEIASFPSKKQRQSLCCSMLICKLLFKNKTNLSDMSDAPFIICSKTLVLHQRTKKTKPCDQQKKKSEKAWQAHV